VLGHQVSAERIVDGLARVGGFVSGRGGGHPLGAEAAAVIDPALGVNPSLGENRLVAHDQVGDPVANSRAPRPNEASARAPQPRRLPLAAARTHAAHSMFPSRVRVRRVGEYARLTLRPRVRALVRRPHHKVGFLPMKSPSSPSVVVRTEGRETGPSERMSQKRLFRRLARLTRAVLGCDSPVAAVATARLVLRVGYPFDQSRDTRLRSRCL
jgi:hypothetical protein